MKPSRVSLVALLFCILPSLLYALPKVAVLDLSVQKGIDASVVVPVTESVMEEVVGARAYVVLDRAYIEQILKEKEFQLSGMVSDTQVAQAGQYLGADYVVAGKIQLIGDTYFVVAKMIEVKTGVIVAQSSEQGEGKVSVLLTMAHTVGKKLVTGAPISALAPAAPTPAAPAPVAAATAPAAPAAQASAPAAPATQASAERAEDRVPTTQVRLSLFAMRDFKGPDAAVWQELLDGFRRKYPNIALVEDSVKDVPLYYQKLAASVKSGKAPDLFYVGGNEGPSNQNPAKDLRPFLRGREAEFLAPVLRPKGDGAIRYLPDTVTATGVLYANGAILDRLGLGFPKTLDELMAQAPAIRAAGLTPIAIADKDGWQMQSCLLSTLVARSGGDDWIVRALSGKGASFKDSSFVAALDAIKNMAQAKLFAPDILNQDYGVSLQTFLQSKAAYMIDGSWRANDLINALDIGRKNALIIGSLPDLPGQAGSSGSTSALCGGYAMNEALSGDRADAAWLWLWYYEGPEGQRIRFERHAGNGAFATMDPRKLVDDVDPVLRKLFDFLGAAPEVDIIDSRMNCSTLNPALQQLVAGKKKSTSLAADLESWVSRNEPARRNR